MNAGTIDLDAESRTRLAALTERHWALAGEHPLSRLHGRALGAYRLFVLLGARNNVGSQYYQLFLVDAAGRLSDAPLAVGLFNSGPFPAFNWIEFTQYRTNLRVGDDPLDLRAAALELPLFDAVSALVPAGGHIMVEYDSPDQFATARVLTLAYPHVCSPTGYLLFRAGCRSYRDWYISEGGREGPRKLQGFKPLNEEIARDKTATMRAELERLLAEPDDGAHGEWGALARTTARDVLERLG